MAAYEYRFENYSLQDMARKAAAHTAMDAMVADGWHIHTASVNFIEATILWERGGSATAERVKNAFEESGVLPPKSEQASAEPPAE